MSRVTVAALAALAALFGACSPASPEAHHAPAASTTAGAAANADVRSRLQGTWELVTFISSGPIPEEATPVLAALHGAVRLRFEADNLTTFLTDRPEQETCPFQIEGESGDAFTLVTSAGMFRKAQARFLSADRWEATENGPTWPGTTRFQRVAR